MRLTISTPHEELQNSTEPASKPKVFVAVSHTSALPALLIDAVFIIAVSIVSHVGYSLAAFGIVGDLHRAICVGAVIAITFCGTTRLSATEQTSRASQRWERGRRAVAAWLISFGLLLFILFALKVTASISRGALLSFFVAGMPTVILSRLNGPILVATRDHAAGFPPRNSVVVMARQSNSRPLSMRDGKGPLLVLCDPSCDEMTWSRRRAKLIAEVANRARQLGRGDILVFASGIPQDRLSSILRGLAPIPRSIRVIPDEAVAALMRHRLTMVGSNIAVEVQRQPFNTMQRFLKRGLDIFMSTSFLVFLLPVFVIIAMAIKLDSPGPIIFTQVRRGSGGRPFHIFKFRTMSVSEDGSDVVQARKVDDRVTRVGAWLRRWSLDELPQFVNVLLGHMSLVGPRPHATAHDEHYAKLIENYELRQHVKPGITGWAQVHGQRGETTTVEAMLRRIESDLWYSANCSILLDLGILLRTLIVVIRRVNAY